MLAQIQPNFFIVGAPKCGTTAFAEYLRRHPAVYLTNPKEPRYFARHLSVPSQRLPDYVTDWEAYMSLYEDADPSVHTAIGEASTTYLRSERALNEIRSTFPEARILVFVRNPVELAFSWHGQKVIEGQEALADFEEAWRAQERRRLSEPGKHVRQVDSLDYLKVSSVGRQLEVLLGIFPQSQIKIVFQEDLSGEDRDRSPELEVLEFLGLQPVEGLDLRRVRDSVDVRFPRLWRALNNRPESTDWIVDAMKRLLGSRLTRLAAGVRGGLVKQRGQLDSKMRKELVGVFADEISRVERMTGRDLSHWREE